MPADNNEAIARELVGKIAERSSPDEIADLFSEDLSFEIQGDAEALPWIGRQRGRQAIVRWMENRDELTEPLAFNVEDVLASEDRAAIVGTLRTRIKSTGKTTTTQFALILTISSGLISRFQMLEDSFDVSNAAR